MSAAPAATAESIATDTPRNATNAMNHGIAWRGPTNSSAPIGAVNAQSETADEFSKPPRLHCSANGNNRLIQSWLRLNSPKRALRAKTKMLAAVASWYARGIAAGSHSPSAA